MSTTIREQIQGGIDARANAAPLDDPEFLRILAAAGARMIGHDGASVEEAARQAVVAGGPSIEDLQEWIRERRRHPETPGLVAA
ncbi:hypothetical protein ACTXJ9_10915 [Brachybacterium tyrofermentans]|uniref:hypothetical protein n=1 Tax=Brachybacterium tyrofermentans TaxID=47848 RepID=UPI003FD350D0